LSQEDGAAVDPLESLKDPAFRTLGTFLIGDVPLHHALLRLAELACVAVPGCDMAGLTLLDGERPTTAVATTEQPPRIDAAQYEAGKGPALDAIRLAEVQHIDDTETERRWPEFVAAARAEGVGSVMSVPMVVAEWVVGACTMYGHAPGAFAGDAAETASLFAGQAALAVASSLSYWHEHSLVLHLQEALRSRPVIEQAKGILMAGQGITADEAFDTLRRASQRENRKLRDVALDLVERAVQRARDGAEPA
jgi:GAF domain-containing protein